MNEEINEDWECFLCATDFPIKTLPTGYLSNSHPLCKSCADNVLNTENHKHRFRLSYHTQIGDLQIIANIPVVEGYLKMN
jgi:hypothetical protein